VSEDPCKTIVVIDDDPAVLQAYGRLLQRLGHHVVLIGDVEKARRDPILLHRADLLIVDQRMPRVTGLELLRSLRPDHLPAGAAIGPRVLLISAYLDEGLRAAADRLGVFEVIEKPVDASHFVRSVRAALAEQAEGSAA
jgi:two-component system C4-dicarboxylate transport response regulator DctD